MYFCMIQIYWFDFYMFFEGLYFDSCSIFWASVSYINSLMGLSGLFVIQALQICHPNQAPICPGEALPK